MQEQKCVIVIDETLPLGIVSNTAAIMGVTLGQRLPNIVGEDVIDKTGNIHLGITQFPLPILKGTSACLKEIREKLYEVEYEDMIVVDFSDVAQSCNKYDEFINKISQVEQDELKYLGIAICGNKKKVNRLTGSMPLLR